MYNVQFRSVHIYERKFFISKYSTGKITVLKCLFSLFHNLAPQLLLIIRFFLPFFGSLFLLLTKILYRIHLNFLPVEVLKEFSQMSRTILVLIRVYLVSHFFFEVHIMF